MKLLGTYLWTAMDYPDRPWGWDHDKELCRAFEHVKAEIAAESGLADAARLKLGHTVGYWDRPGVRTLANFIGVVTPRSWADAVIYPKEGVWQRFATKWAIRSLPRPVAPQSERLSFRLLTIVPSEAMPQSLGRSSLCLPGRLSVA